MTTGTRNGTHQTALEILASPSGARERKTRRRRRIRKGRDTLLGVQPRMPTSLGKELLSLKDKDEELKRLPEAQREERRKSSVCLKFGKAGHSWFRCYTKELVSRSVSTLSKKT
jgi:hypothetical protein